MAPALIRPRRLTSGPLLSLADLAMEVWQRSLTRGNGLISGSAVCYDTDLAFGPLAQLGERLVRNQEVGGSSPPRSTNCWKCLRGRRADIFCAG